MSPQARFDKFYRLLEHSLECQISLYAWLAAAQSRLREAETQDALDAIKGRAEQQVFWIPPFTGLCFKRLLSLLQI